MPAEHRGTRALGLQVEELAQQGRAQADGRAPRVARDPASGRRLDGHPGGCQAGEHAGGIGRGEAIAAYLEMGAVGVQLGTRFVCANESIAHPRSAVPTTTTHLDQEDK